MVQTRLDRSRVCARIESENAVWQDLLLGKFVIYHDSTDPSWHGGKSEICV